MNFIKLTNLVLIHCVNAVLFKINTVLYLLHTCDGVGVALDQSVW